VKKLTQLVPDVREALQTALEETVVQVHRDLVDVGPWWSGQFATSWEVQPGKKAIPANIDLVSSDRTPEDKASAQIDVPDSPNLGGYTLGNRSRYRLYAMDVLGDPNGRGRQQGTAPNKTAERFWYDTYRNSQLANTVERTLVNVFRRYK